MVHLQQAANRNTEDHTSACRICQQPCQQVLCLQEPACTSTSVKHSNDDLQELVTVLSLTAPFSGNLTGCQLCTSAAPIRLAGLGYSVLMTRREHTDTALHAQHAEGSACSHLPQKCLKLAPVPTKARVVHNRLHAGA